MKNLYSLTKSEKRMVKAAWTHNLAERLEVLKQIGATKKQIERETKSYLKIIKSFDNR
jgi:hypothetical protein